MQQNSKWKRETMITTMKNLHMAKLILRFRHQARQGKEWPVIENHFNIWKPTMFRYSLAIQKVTETFQFLIWTSWTSSNTNFFFFFFLFSKRSSLCFLIRQIHKPSRPDYTKGPKIICFINRMNFDGDEHI